MSSKHNLVKEKIQLVYTKNVLRSVQLLKAILIGDEVDVSVGMGMERVDEGGESVDECLDPPYKGGLSPVKRASFHFVAELDLQGSGKLGS
jgi:hypothetical protein